MRLNYKSPEFIWGVIIGIIALMLFQSMKEGYLRSLYQEFNWKVVYRKEYLESLEKNYQYCLGYTQRVYAGIDLNTLTASEKLTYEKVKKDNEQTCYNSYKK